MDKKTSNTKAIFWDLQGTLGGEATEDIERFEFLLYLPGLEIYVHEGVQLIHHYVAVVRAYACAYDSNPLAVVPARCTLELPCVTCELYVRQEFLYHSDAARISDQDNVVRHLFRFQVKMKTTAVTVDDKF